MFLECNKISRIQILLDTLNIHIYVHYIHTVQIINHLNIKFQIIDILLYIYSIIFVIENFYFVYLE